MAKKAKSEPVEEIETEEVSSASRSHMEIHEGMAEWLESEGHLTGEETTAEIIAVALARRNEWRKTEEYAAIKEERAERAEERKAEAAERRAARAAKAAEADEEDDDDETPKKKAKKSKKAAASEKAPTKAKKARKSKKAADSDEDPFGD